MATEPEEPEAADQDQEEEAAPEEPESEAAPAEEAAPEEATPEEVTEKIEDEERIVQEVVDLINDAPKEEGEESVQPEKEAETSDTG